MEHVTQFINSIAGLITAIAALLGGLVAILKILRPGKANNEGDVSSNKSTSKFPTAILAVSLICLSGGIFMGRISADSGNLVAGMPLNVRLTTAAWDAYNKKDYRAAIAKTQECIQEFQGSANREQAELKGQSAPVPPTGKVTDADKATIFQRGLLNDVATCFYIQGRSAESLGLLEDAKRSYQQAESYPYARTWDPDGQFFWNPAQSAKDRLSILVTQ
jgi:hypothetical protein